MPCYFSFSRWFLLVCFIVELIYTPDIQSQFNLSLFIFLIYELKTLSVTSLAESVLLAITWFFVKQLIEFYSVQLGETLDLKCHQEDSVSQMPGGMTQPLQSLGEWSSEENGTQGLLFRNNILTLTKLPRWNFLPVSQLWVQLIPGHCCQLATSFGVFFTSLIFFTILLFYNFKLKVTQ